MFHHWSEEGVECLRLLNSFRQKFPRLQRGSWPRKVNTACGALITQNSKSTFNCWEVLMLFLWEKWPNLLFPIDEEPARLFKSHVSGLQGGEFDEPNPDFRWNATLNWTNCWWCYGWSSVEGSRCRSFSLTSLKGNSTNFTHWIQFINLGEN